MSEFSVENISAKDNELKINLIDGFLEAVNSGKVDIPPQVSFGELVDGAWGMYGIIDQCKKWCWEGWGIPSQSDVITPPMLAAALFNEASTQDKCAAAGESDLSYPGRLRALAFMILKVDGHHPEAGGSYIFSNRVWGRYYAKNDSNYTLLDALIDVLNNKD